MKQFRNGLKANVSTTASVPELALHDTPPVRQQHGQYTAAKLHLERDFSSGGQHGYSCAIKELMNFFIFYHPLTAFGPKAEDHDDTKSK